MNDDQCKKVIVSAALATQVLKDKSMHAHFDRRLLKKLQKTCEQLTDLCLELTELDERFVCSAVDGLADIYAQYRDGQIDDDAYLQELRSFSNKGLLRNIPQEQLVARINLSKEDLKTYQGKKAAATAVVGSLIGRRSSDEKGNRSVEALVNSCKDFSTLNLDTKKLVLNALGLNAGVIDILLSREIHDPNSFFDSSKSDGITLLFKDQIQHFQNRVAREFEKGHTSLGVD